MGWCLCLARARVRVHGMARVQAVGEVVNEISVLGLAP